MLRWLALSVLLLTALSIDASSPRSAHVDEAATAAAGRPSAAETGEYVLVLHAGGSPSAQQAADVFGKLGHGITEEQAEQLLQRVAERGSSPVVSGSKETCEQVGRLFGDIGMRTETRPQLPAEKPPQPASEFDGSAVHSLDEATFLRELWKGEGAALVMFYAPWCKHCRDAVPEMKKAALKLQGAGVRVAAVDCDQARGIAQLLGIKGFPTIKYVSRGSGVDYQGPRSALALVAFAQGQARLAGVKASVANAVGGVKAGMKLAMSRVLRRRPAAPAAPGAAEA